MKLKSDSQGELSGFLDEGTNFKGELSFADTLRIDGKFEGSIRDGKLLIIGETADVNAEVHVERISVRGRLRGQVKVLDRVELHRSARCECDLDTKVLVVEEGATFEGRCAMGTTQPARRDLSPIDNLKKFAASDGG